MICEADRQIWIASSSFWLAPFPVASSSLAAKHLSLPPSSNQRCAQRSSGYHFLPEKEKENETE